jgi:CHAD domain-containing protein
MAIAFDRVQKPLRQLRRLLRNLAADPAPEDVHKLRTRTRQIEAIAGALSPSGEKLTRRLLKAIKPLRKAAGGVRDMDVLAARARSLLEEQRQNSVADPLVDSLARLLESLKVSRKKHASGLLDAVEQQRKTARDYLKQYAKQLEACENSASQTRESEQRLQAAAASLAAELNSWPALSTRNLHPFRLKVKELRSVLLLLSAANQEFDQMFDHEFDPIFVGALGTVKEKIGEWHDLHELDTAASQALDPQQDRTLLALIKETARPKLREALAAANALRQRPLQSAAKKPAASERASRRLPVTASPNQAA